MSFRKIAREAVVFMLLGPVVVAIVAFTMFERHSTADAKKAAAIAVYASEVPPFPPPPPPQGFEPIYPVVQVPLTNGVVLYVTDCAQVHPSATETSPAPGTTNGSDCVYFEDFPWVRYGGPREPERLGDPVQVAVEKAYWEMYQNAKSQHRVTSAIKAAFLSLWGFPAGIIVWIFYRLIIFAVKG